MKLSSILTAQSLAFTCVLISMGPDVAQAQLIGGRPTPGQGRSIIGQPPVGQSGTTPIQPNYPPTGYPPTGSANRTDPVKERMNQANRDAADIDGDGRISPEEASRMPLAAPSQSR